MKPPFRWNRRDFLRATTVLTAASAGGLIPKRTDAVEAPSRSGDRGGLVDCNVSLSRWPFRRLPLDETPALVTKLRSQGVQQAWAGSFDALLCKDMAAVNARLADECRKNGRGLLVPFGSINPMLPNWEDDVRRCQAQHKMPGIRLYPNYHNYRLGEAVFARLLDLAGESGFIVQLTVSMEDERTQHPLLRVPLMDVAPLRALLKARPKLCLVLLNWGGAIKGDLLDKLVASGQVFFDISTVENVGGVASLCGRVGANRVLFGSRAPFFYFESALLKLKESALSNEQSASIRSDNARSLLGGARRG